MTELQEFVALLSGEFDNSRQLRELEEEGISDVPAAQHTGTVCNEKIQGLPEGFGGIFLLEESRYTTGGYTRASAHLFLFTQEGESIRLTSYELPRGSDKSSFSYANMGPVQYQELKTSEKFTPAHWPRRAGGE